MDVLFFEIIFDILTWMLSLIHFIASGIGSITIGVLVFNLCFTQHSTPKTKTKPNPVNNPDENENLPRQPETASPTSSGAEMLNSNVSTDEAEPQRAMEEALPAVLSEIPEASTSTGKAIPKEQRVCDKENVSAGTTHGTQTIVQTVKKTPDVHSEYTSNTRSSNEGRTCGKYVCPPLSTPPISEPKKILEVPSDQLFKFMHKDDSEKSIWWKSLPFNEDIADMSTSSSPATNEPRGTEELGKENADLRNQLSKLESLKDQIDCDAWKHERKLDSIRATAKVANFYRDDISRCGDMVNVLQDAGKQAERALETASALLLKATTILDAVKMIPRNRKDEELNCLAEIRKRKFETPELDSPHDDGIDSLTGLPRSQKIDDKIPELESENAELKKLIAELEALKRLQDENPENYQRMFSSYSEQHESEKRFTYQKNTYKLVEVMLQSQFWASSALSELDAAKEAVAAAHSKLEEQFKRFAKEEKIKQKAEEALIMQARRKEMIGKAKAIWRSIVHLRRV